MNNVENALKKVKNTHYGYYHDIGIILEKFTFQEFIDYYVKEFGEMHLRDYLEEQIIQCEIIKSQQKIRNGGN